MAVRSLGRTIAWTAHDDESLSRDRPVASWQSRLQKVGAPGVKLNGERRRDHHRSLRCDELEAMLIYSMGVSVDGFIADREGGFGWSVPSEEQFGFHIAQVRELGGYLCGRRLYETMRHFLFADTDDAVFRCSALDPDRLHRGTGWRPGWPVPAQPGDLVGGEWVRSGPE
jgi:hypothetical protein